MGDGGHSCYDGHMTLIGNHVPPLAEAPHQYGAPPGITVDFDALKAWDGSDNAWWTTRPAITPTTLVVHTNGASGEGNSDSAVNWGNSSKNNTKAHYNLNSPTPTKNVPSGRRGIANSTPKAMEALYDVQDSSFWTIAVETADRGSSNGGGLDLGDFLYDHDELLARLLAYESIVWGFPLAVPTDWVSPGVVTHVEPWDGVFTIYKGKSCPGLTKRDRVLRGDILARAREIRSVWNLGVPTPPTPPSGDDNMKRSWPNRIDSRNSTFHHSLAPGEVRNVRISSASVGMDNPDTVVVNVTAVPHSSGRGNLALWPGGDYSPASGQVTTVNWSPGTTSIASQMTIPVDKFGDLKIRSTSDADFIIDITGIYW